MESSWELKMALKFFYDANVIEVGVDEAGRGSLLGPVFAGAVVWDTNKIDGLALAIKDSKKLLPKKRLELCKYIEENAIACGVGSVDASEIDKINILQATFKAMHIALDKTRQTVLFESILVDGSMFKSYKPVGLQNPISHTSIVNGDNEYVCIAAASILAKVYHDKWIQDALVHDPDLQKYGIATNQGYGSKAHIDAIKMHGISSVHRRSFRPCCI